MNMMGMLKCKNHASVPRKRNGKYKVQVKDNCFKHFKLLTSLMLNPVITPAIFVISLSGDDAVPRACLPARSVSMQ